AGVASSRAAWPSSTCSWQYPDARPRSSCPCGPPTHPDGCEMKSRIMYIERKTGVSEANIGRMTFSRTGKTLYYKDLALVRGGIDGNYSAYDRKEAEATANERLEGEDNPGL